MKDPLGAAGFDDLVEALTKESKFLQAWERHMHKHPVPWVLLATAMAWGTPFLAYYLSTFRTMK